MEMKTETKSSLLLHATIDLFLIALLVAGCQGAQATTIAPEAVAPDSSPVTVQPSPSAGPAASPTVVDNRRPLLMAHYMPWYQSPAVSGYWGWHWTMDHFDPNRKDASGRPEIASHYTPLTGPYDSSDEAVLEYQVLLMKISGIDGVIVDWFGFDDFRDYGLINASAHKLVRMIEKAGLQFAISYEDQSVNHMVEGERVGGNDAYPYGQKVMSYLEETWFGQDAYLKALDRRPVLFVFGPQYFTNPADWETLFSGLAARPVLITLDNHPSPSAAGSFPWPPMWASQDGVLPQSALESYLAGFYEKAENWDYRVGGAFAGFHDIYQEAGVGSSYGHLDDRQGETFRSTLQTALSHKPDMIQLITWNDYGEGTGIEPTAEFGYRYLEIVQEVRHGFEEAEFVYHPDDLDLPLKLFNLRRKYTGDAAVNARLDEAFQAILSGDVQAAALILNNYPE
jgi:hypothetical protein